MGAQKASTLLDKVDTLAMSTSNKPKVVKDAKVVNKDKPLSAAVKEEKPLVKVEKDSKMPAVKKG